MTEHEPVAPIVVIDGEATSMLPPQLQLRTGERPRNTNIAPFPVWIEEAAFVCWLRCDRVMPAAMKMLEEEWDTFVPEGGESATLPGKQTWYAWRRRHDWDLKADQVIASNFPQLRMRDIARLVAAGGAALDFLIGSARGEFDHLHPGTHEARRRSSEVLLVAGGLGTYGSRDKVAPVVKAVVSNEITFEDKTEQELARITMEHIRATKTNHEERRR